MKFVIPTLAIAVAVIFSQFGKPLEDNCQNEYCQAVVDQANALNKTLQ